MSSAYNSDGIAHGVAAFSILKMLLDVMNKKGVLSDEELKIVLNCAEVDVQNAAKGLPKGEAKQIIENIFSGDDPATTMT